MARSKCIPASERACSYGRLGKTEAFKYTREETIRKYLWLDLFLKQQNLIDTLPPSLPPPQKKKKSHGCGLRKLIKNKIKNSHTNSNSHI